MNPNLYVVQSASDVASFSDDYAIIEIDGRQSKTLRQFYEHVAKMMEFPDYFGFTLDSLDELLNDLDWVEDEKIALHFTHTDQLISQERDPKKLASLFNLLDASAEDWKWVDEEDGIDKKELIILVDESHRISQLLEQEGIAHTLVSNRPGSVS